MTSDEFEWRERAACRGVDSVVFFPDTIEGKRLPESAWTQARRLCAQCPVRQECDEYADEVGVVGGMFAGLTHNERWGRNVFPSQPGYCATCGVQHPRKARYCSSACKSKAWRKRNGSAA